MATSTGGWKRHPSAPRHEVSSAPLAVWQPCARNWMSKTPRGGVGQGTSIPLHPPRTFLPLAAVSQLTTSSGPGPTGQGGGGRGGGTRPARRGRLTKLKMGSRFFDEMIKGRRLPVCVRLRVTLIRACCNIPTPRFGGALPWYAGGPFISRMPSGMELRAAQRLLTRITGRTADEIQHGGE